MAPSSSSGIRWRLLKRLDAFVAVDGDSVPATEAGIDALRVPFMMSSRAGCGRGRSSPGLAETMPGTMADQRMELARAQILDDCDGFFRRAAIRRR